MSYPPQQSWGHIPGAPPPNSLGVTSVYYPQRFTTIFPDSHYLNAMVCVAPTDARQQYALLFGSSSHSYMHSTGRLTDISESSL